MTKQEAETAARALACYATFYEKTHGDPQETKRATNAMHDILDGIAWLKNHSVYTLVIEKELEASREG